MKSEIQLKQAVSSPATESKSLLRKKLLTPMLCSVLASVGIFGGVSTLFVGIICVVIHGIIAHDRVFDRASTVLLIAAIPMLLIGSIFLDEIKKNAV